MSHNNVYLLNKNEVIDRVFAHIDNGTTDLGTSQWHEPVDNYTNESRYEKEIALLRQRPVVFCPSAAIPDAGSFISRTAAGTPLLVVRDNDVDLALLFIVVLIVECELDSCGSDSVRFIPEESPFWTNLFN